MELLIVLHSNFYNASAINKFIYLFIFLNDSQNLSTIYAANDFQTEFEICNKMKYPNISRSLLLNHTEAVSDEVKRVSFEMSANSFVGSGRTDNKELKESSVPWKCVVFLVEM